MFKLNKCLSDDINVVFSGYYNPENVQPEIVKEFPTNIKPQKVVVKLISNDPQAGKQPFEVEINQYIKQKEEKILISNILYHYQIK